MSTNQAEVSSTADREIVVSRVFDAPRELVFSAWADTEHVSKWWGPNGFRTTTYKRDFRPGGVWDFVMHGPDGRDYINKVIYQRIVVPELIEHIHMGDDNAVHFHAHTTFEDLNGQTRITMRNVLPSKAVRDKVVREYGAIEGAQQTLERFAQHLASLQA